MFHVKEKDFITRLFRRYYEENSSAIDLPVGFEKREFGFATFEERMIRHKSFQNRGEFVAFLESFAFSDVYYSCAYYDDPEAEMDKKGWLGADLIFDIDADHISTLCDKIHDDWSCENCRLSGKGSTPEKCPTCGGQKFNVRTWPCEACLNSAKNEAAKLLDFLCDDFGFSERDAHIFFSGHRGYHVHVESQIVKDLDSRARKELVDYFCGLGFDPTFFGLANKDWNVAHVLRTLDFNDIGWRGRLAKQLYGFILNAKYEDYAKIGLKRNVINTIIRNKDLILKSWGDKDFRGIIKGVGFETWKKMVDFCVARNSVQIDTVVTTDIHRLIRMGGTLHSKTGLKKTEVAVSEIDDYDPFKNAIAFKKDTASVFVLDAPRFTINGEVFGPYEKQKVELPLAAVVLLVCKGRAGVLE